MKEKFSVKEVCGTNMPIFLSELEKDFSHYQE